MVVNFLICSLMSFTSSTSLTTFTPYCVFAALVQRQPQCVSIFSEAFRSDQQIAGAIARTNSSRFRRGTKVFALTSYACGYLYLSLWMSTKPYRDFSCHICLRCVPTFQRTAASSKNATSVTFASFGLLWSFIWHFFTLVFCSRYHLVAELTLSSDTATQLESSRHTTECFPDGFFSRQSSFAFLLETLYTCSSDKSSCNDAIH